MHLTNSTPTVIHSTFVIERTYPATPAQVFAAFADPAKKRRWFAGGDGHTTDSYQLDFRVGGAERASFRMSERTPFPGVVLTNEGSYLDIVPDRRIVGVYTMTLGGKLISASLTTFEMVPAETGTDLIFTHQGAFFEGADGPQMREDGWKKLLESLSKDLRENS